MGLVPVLRRINARLAERLVAAGSAPGFATEIGNAASTKPGHPRLTWIWGRGQIDGGVQIDSAAKVVAIRNPQVTARIQTKLQGSPGVSDRDYEQAEEILRQLFVTLDEILPGDYEATMEDWSKTQDGPAGGGVVVDLVLRISVKVLDDPWTYTTQPPTPEPAGGELDFDGVIHG